MQGERKGECGKTNSPIGNFFAEPCPPPGGGGALAACPMRDGVVCAEGEGKTPSRTAGVSFFGVTRHSGRNAFVFFCTARSSEADRGAPWRGAKCGRERARENKCGKTKHPLGTFFAGFHPLRGVLGCSAQCEMQTRRVRRDFRRRQEMREVPPGTRGGRQGEGGLCRRQRGSPGRWRQNTGQGDFLVPEDAV
jgi:hypothetical protein